MGKLSLSAAHYLTQAGLSLPAGAHTVLQTTEQKTANPQMRKQVGFLLPNKALSVESFLYWLKPVAEIKNQNKRKNQPLGGMLSALLVMPAALAVQRQTVCWRHTGLLGTHRSAGDTLPPRVHRAHQQPTLRAPQTHTLQFSCALTFVHSAYFSSPRFRRKTQPNFLFLFLSTVLA